MEAAAAKSMFKDWVSNVRRSFRGSIGELVGIREVVVRRIVRANASTTSSVMACSERAPIRIRPRRRPSCKIGTYAAVAHPNCLEYADTLQRLDLILMDIRLPYEDGYGALKKIRASERLKNIPIIAVTAEASTDQMTKAKDSGFDGFLGKPLDPDRFPDQIRRILAGEPVWEFS